MLGISVLAQLVGEVSPVSTLAAWAPPAIRSRPLGPKAMASMVLMPGLPCSAWTKVDRPRSNRHAKQRERFIRWSSDEERGLPSRLMLPRPFAASSTKLAAWPSRSALKAERRLAGRRDVTVA